MFSSYQNCPWLILSYLLISVICVFLSAAGKPRVAVVREEGSNGDREMSVSLFMAGFEVYNRSFINWIYVDLSNVVDVHDSSLYLCVGVGCHNAGPVLWLFKPGAFQSSRVRRRIQLRRRAGIS